MVESEIHRPEGNMDDGDDDCDLAEWERNFRAAAKRDNYAIFRDHLRRLELPDEPLLLLRGTVQFVKTWYGFFSCDHEDGFSRLLRMQTYDPAQAGEARYAFTFDLFGKAYARVLVDTKCQNLDLADMHEAPWHEYQVAGYRGFWISHLDWSPLTDEEKSQLEEEVTDDLRFDYSEDELDFWFDDSLDETYLSVCVQEVYDTEDENEDEFD